MGKHKNIAAKNAIPEWQRRTHRLIRLVDQGPPCRLDTEMFGIQGRDRSWNLFAENFLSANRLSFDAIGVNTILAPRADQISLSLRPGGTVGAVPLRSPTTRKIVGGIVIKPRFGWNGIGPLLHEIGWTASPQLLDLPLVPGAAKEVPPWVLAGPILERFRALLEELTRGFRWSEEVRQSPRGQILWSRYVCQQASRGAFHQLPCRFPEIGPDIVLRGILRWGIEAVQRSLSTWENVDLTARRLSCQAIEMLHSLSDVRPIVPGRSQLDQLLLISNMPPLSLRRGLEALGWLVDERGLAGTAETDGLAWCLPMYELFERWVEHLIRLWAHGFGAQVQSGRAHETLIPVQWQRSGVHSLSSLIPDLVVRHGRHVWIVDAKYKRHFEELDERRWLELADELRTEHRHDFHQALAYAATSDAEVITTVLAYPMRLATWQRLVNCARSTAIATIGGGSRELRIALVGVPVEMPRSNFTDLLVESMGHLRFDELVLETTNHFARQGP